MHYLGVLQKAGELYRQGGSTVKLGLALSDMEWENVQVAVRWVTSNMASDHNATTLCNAYMDVGRQILDLRQNPRERREWLEAALFAARYLNKRDSEARHLASLGWVCYRLSEMRQAISHLKKALAIFREIGDTHGEGETLSHLGLVDIIGKLLC